VLGRHETQEVIRRLLTAEAWCLIPGQFMHVLWRIRCHWHGFFTEYSTFPLLVLIQQYPILILFFHPVPYINNRTHHLGYSKESYLKVSQMCCLVLHFLWSPRKLVSSENLLFILDVHKIFCQHKESQLNYMHNGGALGTRRMGVNRWWKWIYV
jgi:hypothetical protein